MRTGTVDLGIRGESINPCDHIAFLWETPEEFAEGVGFLEAGLRGDDSCVIFGHEEANERVCEIMKSHGFDVDALREAGRLTALGGHNAGDLMLVEIGGVFRGAIERGAPLIRLLGNIGWGRPDWPREHDILSFEAKVTEAAKAFPCVIVCMYDVMTLPSPLVIHGAFETHPLTICGNVLRQNPYYRRTDEFLAALSGAAGAR